MKPLASTSVCSSPWLFHLSALLLIACVILGGATRTGYLSDAVLQMLCIPVLLIALYRLDWCQIKQLAAPIAFLGALISVPLLQLVPLPPELWITLPRRGAEASSLALINAEASWRPISVAPHATWQSLTSLLVPFTVLASVAQLGHRDRKRLSAILLIFGLLGTFLGMLQFGQTAGRIVRLFEVTNHDDAVGFFANRNHFAAMLYCLMPIAAIRIIQPSDPLSFQSGIRDRSLTLLVRLYGFAALVTLFAAQMMTHSRAGMALSFVALFGCYALAAQHRGSSRELRMTALLVCLIAAVVAVAANVSIVDLLGRFAVSPLNDARLQIAETTRQAFIVYFPFGSGMGTFSFVYGAFEQPANVLPTYINRAHNDIIEWILEAGLAGILLISIFLLWLMIRTLRAWHPPTPYRRDIVLLQRTACLIIWLLIFHSLVDYSLRTAALMALFAFSCALLIHPVRSTDNDPHAGTDKVSEIE